MHTLHYVVYIITQKKDHQNIKTLTLSLKYLDIFRREKKSLNVVVNCIIYHSIFKFGEKKTISTFTKISTWHINMFESVNFYSCSFNF